MLADAFIKLDLKNASRNRSWQKPEKWGLISMKKMKNCLMKMRGRV